MRMATCAQFEVASKCTTTVYHTSQIYRNLAYTKVTKDHRSLNPGGVTSGNFDSRCHKYMVMCDVIQGLHCVELLALTTVDSSVFIHIPDQIY